MTYRYKLIYVYSNKYVLADESNSIRYLKAKADEQFTWDNYLFGAHIVRGRKIIQFRGYEAQKWYQTKINVDYTYN